MKQYTAAEVAALTGRVDRTIRQLAGANGIGRKFGHVWIFTDPDIARFKAIHKGRPRSANYKPRKPRRAAPRPAPATAEQAPGAGERAGEEAA